MRKSTIKLLFYLICCLSIFSATFMVSAKSDDTPPSLKGITVAGYELSPSFSPTTLEYTISIPDGRKMLNVTAIPWDGDTYTVTGASDIKQGDNVITISVQSSDLMSSYIIHALLGAPSVVPSIVQSSEPKSTGTVSSVPKSAVVPPVSQPSAQVSSTTDITSSGAAISSNLPSSNTVSVPNAPNVNYSTTVSKSSSATSQQITPIFIGDNKRENLYTLIIISTIAVIAVAAALIYIYITKRMQ